MKSIYPILIILAVFSCRKGPSISREEVKNLSQAYTKQLCNKNIECSAEYLESLPAKEQDAAKSGFSSLDECIAEQKDASILPDEYEKVKDEQIAKVRKCMDDLLKTPCSQMEESGGIPSCRELFTEEDSGNN